MRDPFLAELTNLELLNMLGVIAEKMPLAALMISLGAIGGSSKLDRMTTFELLNGLSQAEISDACLFEMLKRSRATGFDNRLGEYLALNLGACKQ